MSQASTRVCAAGERIVTEGERGDAVFVVLQGRAGIVVEGVVRASFSAGEFFGEMAVIDSRPRSASVEALEDGTRVLPIDQAKFVYLVSQQPAFALTVMAALSHRLRGFAGQGPRTAAGADPAYSATEI